MKSEEQIIEERKPSGRENTKAVLWHSDDLNSRLCLERFLLIFPSPFVALGLMKVVALTVERQSSADEERQRHKGLFSAEMLLLLRKMRSFRAAGNDQFKLLRRAGQTDSSPSAPLRLLFQMPHMWLPVSPSAWRRQQSLQAYAVCG